MKAHRFGVVLTAQDGISHHDPAVTNDSNILTFNRQKQFVDRVSSDTPVFRHLVDRLCELNPMPEDIGDLTSRLAAPEWLSTAYIRLLLDIYNVGDGVGLMSGVERYAMLENRVQTAAARCHTLHRFWSILTTDLQLPPHPSSSDDALTAFWTLPSSIQYTMLAVMAEQHRSIVTIARLWHTRMKEQSPEYCEKAKREYKPQPLVVATLPDSSFPQPPGYIVLDVPAISVNSLRHQLVREPGWLDLCDRLGLEPKARGEGPLPVGADAIFYNGGNIHPKAVQPANAFALAGAIRELYPLLDLVGGTTSSFDLGESRLRMSAWIVCAENANNLPPELRDAARVSVFDMLDTVTRTRQATADGTGQMIYNYETLVPGSKIYVEMTLSPYATRLCAGALAAALQYYEQNINIVGGQSARGHGHVNVEWLTGKPGGYDDYAAYIESNREALLAGMLDGTLGSGTRVIWT